LRFGLFSPSLVRPRPLARALGASEEKARARRAGRFAGNYGPWLSCSAWLPRLAFREIGPVAGSGFLDRRRAWLGCSIRRPIRLRHAVFPAPVWPRVSMVCPVPAGVPAWRGTSRGSPAAPSGLQVNRGARTVQPAWSGLLDFGQPARRQTLGCGRYGE